MVGHCNKWTNLDEGSSVIYLGIIITNDKCTEKNKIKPGITMTETVLCRRKIDYWPFLRLVLIYYCIGNVIYYAFD